MATPKNSAKLLGYKDTPHDGVYLTYAYAPALSPANKAVFCLGILAKSLVWDMFPGSGMRLPEMGFKKSLIWDVIFIFDKDF